MRLQSRKKWQSPAVEGALMLLANRPPRALTPKPLPGASTQRPGEAAPTGAGRLPEDHAETQALLPRRQDAERGGGRGGKEEAAAQFPQVSTRCYVSASHAAPTRA